MNIPLQDTFLLLPERAAGLHRQAWASRNVQRRVAAPPGNAMTGSRDNDTSVQSQAERDETVAANEGGSERSSVGVKLPWSGTLPPSCKPAQSFMLSTAAATGVGDEWNDKKRT